jgi:hypothetical protein
MANPPTPPIIYETEFYGFHANVISVDYIINQKWARLSGSKQYNKAWDATEMVNDEITTIAQSVTKRSHYETKVNAILALCEVGHVVAVGGDCIGSEVRKHVGYDEVLVNTMWHIVNIMTADEKKALNIDGKRGLGAFDKDRKSYCVFDDFEQVLDKLKEVTVDLPTAAYDLDDDDYGDIDEQAMLNTSDAIEGSASQPIEL